MWQHSGVNHLKIKKNKNLSLYTPLRYIWGVELRLHSLLTSVFDGVDVLTSLLDRFAIETEPQNRPSIRLCECVILSEWFGEERRGKERRGDVRRGEERSL
jgi:hypothetical protein